MTLPQAPYVPHLAVVQRLPDLDSNFVVAHVAVSNNYGSFSGALTTGIIVFWDLFWAPAVRVETPMSFSWWQAASEF